MNISNSISDTIQSGLPISKKLFALAERIVPDITEVNRLATETSLLTSTFNSFRSTFENSDGYRYSTGAAAVAQKILDRCRDIFEELDKVFLGSPLEGLRKDDVAVRVEEELKKTGMKISRGLLEACSITVHLILHNLSTAKQPYARRYLRTSDCRANYHANQIQSLDVHAGYRNRTTRSYHPKPTLFTTSRHHLPRTT